MNDFNTSLAIWLADYFALSTVLLLLALTALAAVKQPAQRLAVTKSTLVALFLLAALCALPGWSVVHLLSPQQPRPNESPAIANHAQNAFEPAPLDAPEFAAANNPLPAAPAGEPAAPQQPPFWSRVHWPTLLAAGYSVGSLCILIWLCLGSLAARRLVRSATPAPAHLTSLIADLIAPKQQRVCLLLSSKIDVAVAIGIRHPTILLPQVMLEPNSALRPILAHELAHITNHDLHWLAASRALLVLLWPQPLFWFLRRHTRLDQEALADAAAAEITTRQSYAEQLVAWARQLPPHPAPRLSAAIGLWESPSQLRQRIALLIDEHFTVLRYCSRRVRLSVTCLAITCALALSTITIQRPHRADAQDALPADTDAAKPSAASRVAAANARDIPYPEPNKILGRAVDENDLPIGNAEVFLFRVNRHDASRQLIAQKTTAADGRFRFDNVIDIANEFPGGRIPPLNDLGDELLQLVTRAPHRVSDVRLEMPQQIARHGNAEYIVMKPAAALRGRVTGPDGQPVVGALVSTGVSPIGRWEGALSARTDNDGNYTITDAAPFDLAEYRKQQDEQRRAMEKRIAALASSYSLFIARPTLTIEHPDFAIKKTDYDNLPGTKNVQLDPPAIIEGRVLYADSKKSAAGALVQAATSPPNSLLPRTSQLYDRHQAGVRAGADGKFRFTTLPAGTYDLWVVNSEWVNAGIQKLAAATEKTTLAPDLILTKGGLIKVRLVDAKTGQPIKISPNTFATLLVQPASNPSSRPIIQRTVPANRDGTFEIRTTPGQNKLIVASVSVNQEPTWSGETDGFQKPGFKVTDGETTSIDVPVTDIKDAPPTGSVLIESPRFDINGKPREAIEILTKTLKEHPDDTEALLLRSLAWQRLGEYGKAVADLKQLISLDPPPPKNVIALNNLAALLSTAPDNAIRNGNQAVELALQAQQLAGESATSEIFDTLAAAYAETGDFEKAVETQRKAIELAPANEEFRTHLELYRANKPLREQSSPPPGVNTKPPTNAPRPTTDDKTGQTDADREYAFPITVTGKAFDVAGKPIVGAEIFLAAERPGYKRLAQTRTDAAGKYAFNAVPLPIHRNESDNDRDSGGFEVFGIADGYALTWRPTKWFYPLKEHLTDLYADSHIDRPPGYGTKDPIKLDLTFGPPHTLRGRVIDDLLQPIPNTTLSLRYADSNWDQADFGRTANANELQSLNERAIVPPSVKTRKTGADGRFEFTDLPADYRWSIDVRPPGHTPRTIWAVTRDGITADATGTRVYSGDFDLEFAKPRKMKIRVVYGDTGKPAPLVGIGGKVSEAGFWETTDVDGLVEVPLADGRYELTMFPRWRTPYLRSEGEITVGREIAQEITTFTLRPAAVANITVIDADTGAPLEGVDVWLDKEVTGSNRPPIRSVYGYRSWEVESRISHYDAPRTDKDGRMEVYFEPGKQRIGVGREAYPAGYEPVDVNGKEVELVASEPQTIAFQLRRAKPAADPVSPTPATPDTTDKINASEPVDIPIIVAKHVLLHDGKIIEWADVERLVTSLPNPKLARPGFYFTHGGLPERQEEIRTKVWDFRQSQPMAGHVWSGIAARTSIRYDAIRTAADLVPNKNRRVDGTVETADGLPIDSAEVVLAATVDESIPYKTVDLYLRNERLRNPLDEVVTTSDNSGRFAVYPPPNTPYYLIALHKEGFGLVRSDDFAKSSRITIQPWAHIRGTVKSDARFQQTADVTLNIPAVEKWPELEFHYYSEDLGPPSPDGRFEFAFIPPQLPGVLRRGVKGEQGSSFSIPVRELTLAPSETLDADIDPPTDADIKQIESIKSLSKPQPATAAPSPAESIPAAEKPLTAEITGQVLDPDGTPAAGVPMMTFGGFPKGFIHAKTNDEGHFKFNLPVDADAIVWVRPQDFCQQLHYIAKRRGDLGTYKLENGIEPHGRVVDVDGKPLANVWVNARPADDRKRIPSHLAVAEQLDRSATTDEQGRFSLAPLPPGKYVVVPTTDPFENVRGRAPLQLPAAFMQREYDISAASELDEIELRAVPSHVVTVRVSDSRGKPAEGFGSFFLQGDLPDSSHYSVALAFDRNGKAVEHVPRGVKDVFIDIPYRALSIRHRAAPGAPLNKNLEVDIGALHSDRTVEVIRYRTPVIYVDVRDAAGNRPLKLNVAAGFKKIEPAIERSGNRATSQIEFEAEPDGRWKSKEFVPDEEFKLTVTADGYEPYETTRSLAEGEQANINVTIQPTK